ncbi:MAG: cation transporter [Dyella sp.]|uniref:cation transporter n=1 Tax=Dyella sp. TaxID=1869338 RepID=UPI003F7FF6DA
MADSCCGGCNADLTVLHAAQRRVLTIVLIINALTFVGVLTAALWSGSSSLLSGGLDNLGDALAYGLSLMVVGASVKAQARVALFKASLILAAALAVAARIGWHVLHPVVPTLNVMSLAALANLAANAFCLFLLTPHRDSNVNMASVWECSRNDVIEGVAVLLAAGGVWLTNAGWPDLAIAAGLLVMFLRSAARVFRRAWAELRNAA